MSDGVQCGCRGSDPPNAPRKLGLSIIMPAHNEERTISVAVDDVLRLVTDFPLELIVVDDGSRDATAEALAAIRDPRVIQVRHATNRGKGAAVLTGARRATLSHMVVFDADCEYSAADLPRMFNFVAHGQADVVYGTRIIGMNTVYQSYRYALGNRAMTTLANVLFDACLSDLHTCLKMLPVELFYRLDLGSVGFGLDTEMTAELLRRGYRPVEVPVSYLSRSHSQGKKIGWRDGVECVITLGRIRLKGRHGLSTEDQRVRGSRLHQTIDLRERAGSAKGSSTAEAQGREAFEVFEYGIVANG